MEHSLLTTLHRGRNATNWHRQGPVVAISGNDQLKWKGTNIHQNQIIPRIPKVTFFFVFLNSERTGILNSFDILNNTLQPADYKFLNPQCPISYIYLFSLQLFQCFR